MTIANIEYHIPEFGDPSVIQQAHTILGAPAEGQVRLRILAAGLSMADVLIRRGVYLDVKKPGIVIGYEAIAVIESLGKGVSDYYPNLTIGSQVAVMSLVGNNTHFRNIDASQVVKLPQNVASEQLPKVASLMLNYVTAYQMLHRQSLVFSKNTTHKRILIHSAAGGVGTALIQLLARFNVTIYGTASQKNHKRLNRYGVIPIDYRHQDVALLCQAAGGMDLVFDGIGGRHLNLSNKCLTTTGKLVFFGMTDLIRGEQPSRFAFLRYLATTARYLIKTKFSKRYWFYSITDYRNKQPNWFTEDFNTVFGLFLDGTITPELAPVLPMSELAEAHRKLEFGELRGKQVFVPDPLFN